MFSYSIYCQKFSKVDCLNIYPYPCGLAGKESACNVGDLGLIPGLRTSPGEGKGYPLQYSSLENSMDCTVHGVAESDTTEQLSLSPAMYGNASYFTSLTTVGFFLFHFNHSGGTIVVSQCFLNSNFSVD